MATTPDLPTRALRDCTCFNLRKAARAVTQRYDEFLRPARLRATQFSLLAVLAEAGPVSIGQLAEAAVTDRTTLKRNLELLERDGLVRIRPGTDARVREVSLTPAARKRLAAAIPLWQQAQAHLIGQLGDARAGRFLADLSAAVAAAHVTG